PIFSGNPITLCFHSSDLDTPSAFHALVSSDVRHSCWIYCVSGFYSVVAKSEGLLLKSIGLILR
ncbi:MAG: hypothetical protein ABSD09_19520, partial [Xanthobacteraceae bacterium]